MKGGARRAPSAPPGRSERSEHIDKSRTTHRVRLIAQLMKFMIFGNCYEREK
jgi:hypothetical protein